MKNSNIKISIITATWNSENTLTECIESVTKQKYQNREHIIIDAASTDNTIKIIQANIKKIDNYISEKDSGIYEALNKGINLATGEVVGFLHSDDFYPNNDTLLKISEIFKDKNIDAVYGDLDYVNKKDINKVVRKWRSKKFKSHKIYWGWMPAHPTLYVRKKWYTNENMFDTSFKISADYLSTLRLFTNSKFKAKYLPQVLVKMRTGGASNKSLKSITIKTREDWKALRKCNFSIARTLQIIICKNLRKINQFI